MERRFKKITKYVFLAVAAISGLILLVVAGFLVYATITDYKPTEKESIVIGNIILPDTIPAGRLELYTWNIGYCGLGQKMDFFYEGGTMVRPEEDYYKSCRDRILSQIGGFNKPDFILIQEIDQQSDRTYCDDQVALFNKTFNEYITLFALNYKVPFVPVPLRSPMGKVKAGLMTMSHFRPVEATRYSFPSSYSWPKRLSMLDRGCILSRYKVSNGKELVLINTHNSAFNDAADMRSVELNLLKGIIETEYSLGNYVIVGGDWNQNPVPFKTGSVQDGNLVNIISPGIPADFLPATYTWAFDPLHPTNRDVNQPYVKGKTNTTIIDFFILSPNITLLSVNTVLNNFEFSDHQPVRMSVELK